MTKNETVTMSISHPPKEKPIRNLSGKFTEQEVNLTDSPLFFPAGHENLFLAIYFVAVPYIMGLVFLFFYVANAKLDLFLSLNEQASFILTWLVGYEIVAAMILLYIIKLAISFSTKGYAQGFVRP